MDIEGEDMAGGATVPAALDWGRVGKHAAVAALAFTAVVGGLHLNGMSSVREWNESMTENADRGSWAPILGQNLSHVIDAVAAGDRHRVEWLAEEFEGSVGDYLRCDQRDGGFGSLFSYGYCPGEETRWRTVRAGDDAVVVIGPLKRNVASAAFSLLSPNPGARVEAKAVETAEGYEGGLWTDARADRADPLPRMSDGMYVAMRITSQRGVR